MYYWVHPNIDGRIYKSEDPPTLERRWHGVIFSESLVGLRMWARGLIELAIYAERELIKAHELRIGNLRGRLRELDDREPTKGKP